jgi:pimeloyl-ACP methyl ester carboxylesterase
MALGAFAGSANADTGAAPAKSTTIVLVHGAFAGSSSWNSVISDLAAQGNPVIAVANPLRGLKSNADYVARSVASVPGPVVLVGHSHGGEVITLAGSGAKNVEALVFVSGLAPDSGESAASLGERFPGGTLGQALARPIPLADVAEDLYIRQEKYWAQFAADVSERDARVWRRRNARSRRRHSGSHRARPHGRQFRPGSSMALSTRTFLPRCTNSWRGGREEMK